MWPARGIDTNSDLVTVKTKQFQRQHFNIFHWLSLHIPSVAGSRGGQTVDLGDTPACIQCGPCVSLTLPISTFDPVWAPKMLLPITLSPACQHTGASSHTLRHKAAFQLWLQEGPGMP